VVAVCIYPDDMFRVSALAMGHHQVYTNVIRVLYRYNKADANEIPLWYLTAGGVYMRRHTVLVTGCECKSIIIKRLLATYIECKELCCFVTRCRLHIYSN
jgi:hypothetical protein